MLEVMHLKSKLMFAFCCCAIVLAACGRPLDASAVPTRSTLPEANAAPTLAQFPGTPTPQCPWEEVLPKIDGIRPEEIRPGTEVTVTADGGYFKDNCGGVNESARTYQIFFDDEPVGDLQCYVNHCEGKFVLSASVPAGRHCMGVQKGSCQTEVDVVGE